MLNSHEIARIAGVSRSTVSRIVNGQPNVSEETREKVLQVIKEYNYHPNISGRMLVGEKPNVIGLFFVEKGNLLLTFTAQKPATLVIPTG